MKDELSHPFFFFRMYNSWACISFIFYNYFCSRDSDLTRRSLSTDSSDYKDYLELTIICTFRPATSRLLF